MRKTIIIIPFLILAAGFAKDYKGAELRTIASYTYGRFEVRMQSAAGSGMLSSFFTYHDGGGAWNEIDLEILGQYDDEVQFNTITPGQVNHVHDFGVDFNPHEGFHVYAFEWTPNSVAWFVDDDLAVYDSGGHISQLNLAQKIMMNMWIPDYPSWVGPWNDDILPLYAFYDWVSYSSYTPGTGDTGSGNNFTHQWTDNFETWDQTRWQKATHTWWGNNCDFTPQNVVFQDGYMILCLTDNYNLGFSGEIPGGQDFLAVQGSEIVDMDGSPILLKGYGLGGWLVPEGYMLHIPGYGSPTTIRNRIVDLVGETIADSFYDLYEQNYVNQNDINLIADWGFNSIRLPFHYNKLSPEPGVFLEEGFAQIDTLLAWCEENQLYLILDMHCAPGGQNPGNISDSNGEALLWTTQSHKDHTVEIWREIAERYTYEPWIGGYDLLNEPVLPEGYNNNHLRGLYIDITEAIREVDQNHIIFIEGNWYATDFALLTPPFDDNLVYAFHKYWNSLTQGSLSNYLAIRNSYNVPLWLGETGENSNHWFAMNTELMAANNIGWNWWAHKKLDTTTSPLSAEIPDLYQGILDYWNGTGPQPPSYAAIAGLMQMAEALALENCVLRQGVLESILNPDYADQHYPFAQHSIPGIINAVDYDYGINGIAYNDDEYMMDYWETWINWNEGEDYRNDGVDIEHCIGNCAYEYNLGWTSDDEWLNYSVDIQNSGNYNLAMNVASPDGGWFHMKLDGNLLFFPRQIQPTGGWYSYEDQMINGIYMTEGPHVLQLYINQGGFNLGTMAFLPPGISGDLNSDLNLDVLDVVVMVDIILGGTNPTTYQQWAGDMNEDSAIDVLDVVLLVDSILNP